VRTESFKNRSYLPSLWCLSAVHLDPYLSTYLSNFSLLNFQIILIPLSSFTMTGNTLASYSTIFSKSSSVTFHNYFYAFNNS